MSESKIKKQALLIGINHYPILPQLKYARQDAEAVKQSLMQNYCFSDEEIVILTDEQPGQFQPLSKRKILNHLEKLVNQELDLFIFGFWGHGLFRNNERYLCPLETAADDVEESGVSFQELQETLSKIRAKNTCMILDCCQTIHEREGDRGEEETLTAADQAIMENVARDIVLKRKEQIPEFHSNVAVLNSCKEGQSAYEWEKRQHGVFTAHLIDAMNRRYDSVAKIIGYISSNVEKTARELGKTQTPFYKLEGDISLPVNTESTALVTGDVFISYRHANADLVVPVEEELKKRDISYFIDRVGINYGMDYSQAISQGVKECKVLLVLWTQDANSSLDMLREVKMALDLKKRVIPYKIGTFNAMEHDALYYQLSPLSRYEVPVQTSESVVEIVNRIEQALTGKVFQQYTVDPSLKSQDVVIQKPKIDDIKVVFTPEPTEPKIIPTGPIQFPPLPEQLLRIQAENRGLEKTIDQLKAFNHESLAQADAALAQAQAQLDAWVERKKRLWKDLPQSITQSLEKTISNNPECTEKDIAIPTNNLSYDQYFDFIEQFQCGKKCEQAKRELERVKKERITKCNDAIAKCQQKINNNVKRFRESSKSFLDNTIMTILSVMPGYKDANASFPESAILDPLRQLGKYDLTWRPDEILGRTRELWAKKRPCAIKAEEEKREQELLAIQREKKGVVTKPQIFKEVLFITLAVFIAIFLTVLILSGDPQGAIALTTVCMVFLFILLPVLFYLIKYRLVQKAFKLEPGQTAGERAVVTIYGVEFAFRWCPSGTFMMGSPKSEAGRQNDETLHKVTLTKGFWMLETEITQKQWDVFMETYLKNHFTGDNLPIDNASWFDCQEFSMKTSLQLPTEAQWEYACRAGTTEAFSGNLAEMAWYNANSDMETHPVGTKKPNAWGLYDMHGNVNEWCKDCYTEEYPNDCETDPVVSSGDSKHVIRGGGCEDIAQNCRSASRFISSSANKLLGFRCVIVPKQN